MSEHTPHSPEHQSQHRPEHQPTPEHHRQAEHQPHQSLEHHKSKQEQELTEARQTAAHEAVSSHEYGRGEQEDNQPAVVNHSPAERNRTYQLTMGRLQGHMSTVERQFSRLIHAPAVDKASEAVGKTVARPSALLGAGIAACVGLSIVYWIARQQGFSLSGSEFLVFGAAGWAAGLVAELVYRSVRRLRAN